MTGGAPLVVVGDALLDIDIEGTATRLSPEAPVPVVDVQRGWQRPGGAGLAALLAARTCADVVLIAGIADDEAGHELAGLVKAAGVRLIPLPMRGSTVAKTRVRAGGQSVLRLDRGTAVPISGPVCGDAGAALAAARAICVADYGAGMSALPRVRDILSAQAHRTPIVWDPHPRGAPPVPGCTLVTPNEAEAQAFSRGEGAPGEELRARWQTDALCVTRGARGARVFSSDGRRIHIGQPSPSRESLPGDACGAGDRFAVAAATALGSGSGIIAAVETAVDAAARFVAAGGAISVSSPVADSLDLGGQTTNVTDAVTFARQMRHAGRTVVATGGCFDLVHTGHIRLLRAARQLGDALVVLINSDDSVRALKGPDRPVMTAADRARVLAALACVDAVAVFDDATPERLLAQVQPDVWVKGGDYRADDLPEADVVRRHGGDVAILPTVAGYSSSALIAAARSGQPTER